jgi:MFS family permease
MLVGGTITDRLSPRRVMLTANLVRGVLTGLLATAALSGITQMWMLYAAGVLFGTVAGFAVPAENSIVPQLVRGEELQAGNSVIMGLTQLASFVGPSLAGVLIAGSGSSLTGVATAYGLDAATFAISAITLAAMRGVRPRATGSAADGPNPDAENVLAATAIGIRHLWHDRALRILFTVLLVVNLLLIGPLMVGIPQLAHQRLPGGAAAFGLLMSAFALGNLAGYLAAAGLPRPGGVGLRRIVIGLVAAFGVGVASLGVLPWTWADAGVLGLLGLGNGFMAVILITWMQSQTPASMVGRMMSLMMLATTGLVPLSQAAAGVIARHDLTLLFTAPGALVLAAALGLAFVPSLAKLGRELAHPSASANRPT